MATNPVVTNAKIHEPRIQELRIVRLPEPKVGIISLRQRVKKLLHKIFSGHEEFLGVTPD